MTSLAAYLRSSVGKKLLMGVSGLIFSGFVLTHMAGNMLILVGADAYNKYSYGITSNLPLLYGAETVLVLSLLLHVVLAVQLTVQNRVARTHGYNAGPKAGNAKRTRLAARTLILTGLVILAFIILHLKTFKYGEHYTTTVGGIEMRDLHRLIVEKFKEPGYVAWYVFSLLLLCAHLSHGVAASLQSLGVLSARNCTLKALAWAFAIVVALGFISQPLYIFFFS